MSKIAVTTDEKTGKDTHDLQLKRNHRWINCHNRRIAVTNRSNTDAQPILDLHKVVNYITKYICKPEPKSDMMEKLTKAATTTSFAPLDPVRQLAQRLLIRCVGDRDYSAQETIQYLMGYSQYLCSRTFVSVYLKIDEEDREIEVVQGKPTIRPGRMENYMNRPATYNNTSLRDYYRQYNIGKRITKREKDAIVVPQGLRRVSVDSPHYENYCSNYLMFHKPFRHIADLKDDYETYSAALNAFLEENSPIEMDLDEAVNQADDDRERGGAVTDTVPEERVLTEFALLLQQQPDFLDQQEFGEADWLSEYNANPQMYDQADQFLSSVMGDSETNVESIPDPDISHMNTEQLSVFEEVKNHLDESEVASIAPLRKIVTGTAGTGKSYLINSLRGLLKERVIVVGPTGVCACNVQGQTVHSALRIPIKEFKDINGPALEQLQEKWKDISYVILEEMSMIGLRLFNKIDRRLRQIFPGVTADQEYFGGRSVIMFGDFGQLTPPGDTCLYRQSTNEASRAGRIAYKKFDSCTILKQVVRQDGEENETFRQILLRICRGEVTKNDFKVLESRFYRGLSRAEKRDWTNDVRLFAKTAHVARYNLKKLLDQQKPIAQINAENTGGPAAVKATFEDCGLEPSLLLCEEAKIMLTANLSVGLGLCNGTVGAVNKIVYRQDGPPRLPLCILCKFPSYKGPGFVGMPNMVPIFPITRRFHTGGVDCTRTAIPLRLAWAITIHKAQGLTLDRAIVDIGDKEFSNGLTFVALSRVRRLTDLRLMPFEFSRLEQLGKEKRVSHSRKPKHRLFHLRQEDERLQRMEQNLECQLETPVNSQASRFNEDVHSSNRLSVVASKSPQPDISAAPTASCNLQQNRQHIECNHLPTLQIVGERTDTVAALPGPQIVPSLRFMGPITGDSQFDFHPIPDLLRNRLIDLINSLVVLYKSVPRAGGSTDVQKVNKVMSDSYNSRPKSFPCNRVPPKRCINVVGDGHCFYHAMSRAITAFDNYHRTLRLLLAEFVDKHMFVPAYRHLVSYEGLPGEIAGRAYAGELEFQWMAAMLQVNIVVFYPKGTEAPSTRPYQWVKWAPVEYLQVSGDTVTPVERSAIYLYFCGVDLKEYQDPNHFCLVTRM